MTQSVYVTSDLLEPVHGFGTVESGLPPLPVVTPELFKHYPLKAPAAFEMQGQKRLWQIGQKPVQAMKQVHGTHIKILREGDTLIAPFTEEGDGVATDRLDIVAAIVTADCAPVLLAGKNKQGKNVVAAVHAGWLGAVTGVIEAGIEAMKELGALFINAAIGPCITASSYEISQEMLERIYKEDQKAAPWIYPGKKEGKYYFDLPGYCFHRLAAQGIGNVSVSGFDTCADSRFWSYRRESLKGEALLASAGRQFSFICA